MALRSPFTLKNEARSNPTTDRLDSAHSGICSAAESDSATISASAPVSRQVNTASVSAPIRRRTALSMAVVTTSRASSIIADCSAKQAAAATGRCFSIPGTGSCSDIQQRINSSTQLIRSRRRKGFTNEP